MGLQWQEVALPLQRQNVTLGQTVNVPGILQDSYTAEFLITMEGVIGTAAATACIEGLPAILQNINISGPLAGYAPLSPVTGLSGPMLVEMGQFIRRNISYSWGALGSTGKFGVTIPCTFKNPRLGAFSLMSCLPTKLMGSVNFTAQVASQAQLDTNGSPLLAFTSLSFYVQQNEYKASTIPPMSALVPAAQIPKGAWTFIPSAMNYISNTSVQAGQQIQQLIPNGTYLLILMRSFTTLTTGGVPTARQSDTVAGGPLDISITSAGIVIQDVNQTPKDSGTFYTMRKKNLDNIYDSLTTGNAAFEYNNGVSRIFQPIAGPNQVPINYATTTTGTTNPRIDFVYQQIYDTKNWLGLLN